MAASVKLPCVGAKEDWGERGLLISMLLHRLIVLYCDSCKLCSCVIDSGRCSACTRAVFISECSNIQEHIAKLLSSDSFVLLVETSAELK